MSDKLMLYEKLLHNYWKGRRKKYPQTKQSKKLTFFLGFILSLGDDIQWLINAASGHVLFSYIKNLSASSPHCLCGWWQELGFSWWWLVLWGCFQSAEWCSDCPFSSGNMRSKCFPWSVSCARGCASLFQQLGFFPSYWDSFGSASCPLSMNSLCNWRCLILF